MTHYKRVLLYSKNIHTLARRCFCHHFFVCFHFCDSHGSGFTFSFWSSFPPARSSHPLLPFLTCSSSTFFGEASGCCQSGEFRQKGRFHSIKWNCRFCLAHGTWFPERGNTHDIESLVIRTLKDLELLSTSVVV